MPLITELSWLPFKPGTESSDAATALKDLGPQLASQPGLEGHWRGAPLERPNSLEFVNVWNSEQAYQTSQSSPLHSEATALIQQLVDTSNPLIKPYHNAVPFDKPFAEVAVAPLVQLSSFFLPADVNRSAFEAAFKNVLAPLYANPPEGFVTGTNGWALETVNGAAVFVAASGWESLEKRLEAHERVKGTFGEVEAFTKVVEVHHTSFQKGGA
ncbi:hypothetical protein QBC39DRAFT_68353 [Podospora conica]|nr:hypothetical protein QBC39DRAFT_68353 [Schizothecium conicum]